MSPRVPVILNSTGVDVGKWLLKERPQHENHGNYRENAPHRRGLSSTDPTNVNRLPAPGLHPLLNLWQFPFDINGVGLGELPVIYSETASL
jgi:hypothetical protein